jgi:hypothetical protein
MSYRTEGLRSGSFGVGKLPERTTHCTIEGMHGQVTRNEILQGQNRPCELTKPLVLRRWVQRRGYKGLWDKLFVDSSQSKDTLQFLQLHRFRQEQVDPTCESLFLRLSRC